MDEENRKSFDQLVKEKAGCAEFVWNGYIRLYEEGEKRCECEFCLECQKVNEAHKKLFRNV